MASSESRMDDSFRDRVEKIFGSLTTSSSPPTSYLQATLWSLTDDEVQRKEWRRDSANNSHRDDLPCSSSFDDCLKKDRRRNFRRAMKDNLYDDNDDGEDLNGSRRGTEDDGVDVWEIRSSIGLDRTLDNEEEEDEFDKVATGRENGGERLYMKDVNDQESYLNFHNVVSKSLHSTRDPRANHLAAKIRLQQDEAEAGVINTCSDADIEVKERVVRSSDEDIGKLRSILKRKDYNVDCKSRKRVRFDPACKVDSEEAVSEIMDSHSVDALVSNDGFMSSKNSSEVPDYLRNPSKYTCYSFDSSSELDEKSNSQACMDFLRVVRSSEATEMGSGQLDDSADFSKSVTFIPKRKTAEFKPINNGGEVKQNKEDNADHAGFLVGIAASKSQLSEVDSMVEDEPETNGVGRKPGFQKLGRRYRVKSSSDDSEF